MIEHLLLTRMNVITPFGSPGASLDRDRLAHRFALFERYTVPSVMAQARATPFTWILFSHPDTPDEFKARLAGHTRKSPWIHIEWRAEFDGVSARQAVAKLLRPETRRVITSRVDNDDSIGRTFMDVLKAEAAKAPLDRGGSFINFDLGYHLHAGAVYRAEHRSNLFCSAVEEREGFKGVYGVKHVDLESLYPVVHVRSRRHWLTVIHDRNASNTVDGTRCPSAALRAEFGFLPPDEVVPYSWLASQTRRARTAARLVASRLKRLVPPVDG